jgi:glycerate 2-kinase
MASAAREILARLFLSAVDAVRGERVLRACSRVQGDRWVYDGPGGRLDVALPALGTGRVIVAGAGKAAASLARGMEEVLAGRIDAGSIIVKHGHAEALSVVRALEADHPVPGAASLAATQELLLLLEATTAADAVFFLLTGGASSLLCMPAEGISFADKASVGRLLVNSGATIEEINIVRKHLSAVKGGRLRRRTPARTFCALAISDVIGDDPSTIGSGPTVPDRTSRSDAREIIDRYQLTPQMPAAVLRHLRQPSAPQQTAGSGSSEYRVIAHIGVALDACVRQAAKEGFEVRVLTDRIAGPTHDAARSFSQAVLDSVNSRGGDGRPLILLAGGETTLSVTGSGKGGRNQEFAVVAAQQLQGSHNVTLLAAGTDGTDGPTEAAGAFADGTTLERARALGLDVQNHLSRNDVNPLLGALGDLLHTGPTGTNVMDLVIALIE